MLMKLKQRRREYIGLSISILLRRMLLESYTSMLHGPDCTAIQAASRQQGLGYSDPQLSSLPALSL